MSEPVKKVKSTEKRIKNTGATGWGDNGAARATTEAYRNNYDAIFNKSKKNDT